MKRALVAATLTGAMLTAPVAHAATWTTVAKRTATGDSVKVIDVTVDQPLALRLKSRSETVGAVVWVVSCAQDGAVKATSGAWYPSLGLDRERLSLPFAQPDYCQVFVSINAEGPDPLRVRLQQR
jgi:hypothetical protein